MGNRLDLDQVLLVLGLDNLAGRAVWGLKAFRRSWVQMEVLPEDPAEVRAS
jgi:hypothetical protein